MPKNVKTYAELSHTMVPGESDANWAAVPSWPTTAESTSERSGVARRIANVGYREGRDSNDHVSI